MPPKQKRKDLKCSNCSLTFSFEKTFETHKEESKKLEITQNCKRCPFKSCTPIGLKNHQLQNPSHLESAMVNEELEILNGPSVQATGKDQIL